MMLFSGFMSAGWFAAGLLVIMGTLGTFSGSMLAYFIGFRFGQAAVLKIGRPFHITAESLARTNAAIEKHEWPYIIFSRFIPGIRHIVPYITGITKLSLREFTLCNLVSSLIWCAVFVSAGKLLGQKWVIFERFTNLYSLAALLVLLFVFLVFKYGGRHRFIIYGAALPVFAFAAIALLQAGRGFRLFDASIHTALAGLSHMRPFFLALSVLGSPGILGLLAVACAVSLLRSRRYAFWGRMLVLDFVFSLIMGEAVDLIFHRTGPQGFGLYRLALFTFPSVNAMLSTTTYGFIAFLTARNRNFPFKFAAAAGSVVLVVASGLSGVYLNKYYASDMLAGFAVGLCWLVLFTVTALRLRPVPQSARVQAAAAAVRHRKPG